MSLKVKLRVLLQHQTPQELRSPHLLHHPLPAPQMLVVYLTQILQPLFIQVGSTIRIILSSNYVRVFYVCQSAEICKLVLVFVRTESSLSSVQFKLCFRKEGLGVRYSNEMDPVFH